MRIGLGQYNRYFKRDSSFYLGGILFSAGDKNDPVNSNDPLIHSIADALLGAVGLGGLYNYPEIAKTNNPEVLSEIERKIHYQKFTIENIDVTITVPDRVVLGKRNEIHSNLISGLFIKSEQLNLKFTFSSNNTDTADYKIQITAIALLKDRS
ncbi:MAG: 2-C-methyl-D-erythritol 2,4-cyclodiphosphate synthase [Calditrichaceae bacterium]|nr:2-C-methyl-D-erythritol 2,4-cyclodiphosphate synthase [Calditrichaceae bacterium]